MFYRSEITGVKVDSVFFLSLAKNNVVLADIEFFQNWRLTFPENTWAPRYVQQQTDYSGCTNYGNGNLSELFAAWSAYTARFPGDYTDDVGERLDSIRYTFANDTCACGDKESVAAELQRFLSAFPGDRSASAVPARLRTIQSDTSQIRFKCQSG